jgi:hypothetical protein
MPIRHRGSLPRLENRIFGNGILFEDCPGRSLPSFTFAFGIGLGHEPAISGTHQAEQNAESIERLSNDDRRLNRKRMCIHERLRSERVRWLSCVCWPTQKIPSVMKVMAHMTSRGASAPAPAIGQQGHGDGEHTVAEGRQALHALAGDPVIGSAHSGQRTGTGAGPRKDAFIKRLQSRAVERSGHFDDVHVGGALDRPK